MQNPLERINESSNPLLMLLGTVIDLTIVLAKLILVFFALNLIIGVFAVIVFLVLQIPSRILVGLMLAVAVVYLLLLGISGAYQPAMIRQYLRSKLAPLFAALAVILCTMMVIIVISVMGGFLELLRDSVKQVTGDVIIDAGSYTGFPHYQELIDELAALPEVRVATPIVRAYGLVQLEGQTLTVMVQGIRPRELNEVVGYRDALHWSRQDLLDDFDRQHEGRPLEDWQKKQRQSIEDLDLIEWSMTLDPPPQRKRRAGIDDLPGAVIGIEVAPYSRRNAQGQYSVYQSLINEDITLTVVPLTERGALLEPAVTKLAVLNEFKSGLFDIDANTMFVPFDMLQKMLQMDAAAEVDDNGEPTGETIPARATEITLRAAEDYTADQAAKAVDRVARDFVDRHEDIPWLLQVRTWEQRHQQLLGAVQNEKGLVTFLFAFISLVAIVFVAVTFWLIVQAKTRDIGVLRAIGASRVGIANIFLGYGLAIGIVGSALGLLAAIGVVTHLNEIQAILDQYFGWRMWDPQTYYFDRIPDQVNPTEARWIVICAILSSLIGSLIPAIRAAWLNPVEALRYE